MNWLKKLKALALPNKSAPELPPTAPPSQAASANTNPGSSGEYTQENLQKLFEQELRKQFGQDVKIHFGPNLRIPLGPNASPPATKQEPASASVNAMATEATDLMTKAVENHERKWSAARAGGLLPDQQSGQSLENGALVTRTFDRQGRLRRFQNDSRYRELMSHHFNITRTFFYDPQADVPLPKDQDSDYERVADQMGPSHYLHWLLREYGGEINPMPTNDHEARRAVRKYIRSLKHYKGEKFIQ